MTKALLMGLLAATALVPASALAQDRNERPRREASHASRSRDDGQRARPERRAPQAPQRDFQNQRPPAQARAPQRDIPRIQPQRPSRPDRPEAVSRPGGDRRPEMRPDRPQTDRGGRRPEQLDRGNRPDPRSWADRDGRRDGRPGAGRDDRRDRDDRGDRQQWRGNNGNWGDRDRDWRDGDRRRRAYADSVRRNDARERQAWHDRRAWSRSWRTDRRYDWNGYRQANRHLYRLPRYYPPSGYHYGYQRFSIGLTLGSMLYGSSYWINDPYAYRLPPSDGPYRWVRYYNDALLVDLESGEVVDVVYDLFW